MGNSAVRNREEISFLRKLGNWKRINLRIQNFIGEVFQETKTDISV